ADIAQLNLTAAPAVRSNAPALIRSRATTRTPFLSVALDADEVDQIVAVDRTALHFVPRESSEGRWLVDAVAEAFAQQTRDDGKQVELAGWLRFSRRDLRTRGDGLSPEALGLSPVAQAIWYAAFTRKQALKASFRRASIKTTQRQLQGCAGFLVVTTAD